MCVDRSSPDSFVVSVTSSCTSSLTMDMDENDPVGEESPEEEDPNEEEEDNPNEEEDSDDDGAEMDEETAAEIERLKDVILTNPFSYDDYVKLISLLRSSGELEEVRDIREQFAKRFPLSPSLWKEWISDEQRIATTLEEKQSVIDLFERALQDYVSVDLWVEYCQFMMSLMNTHNGSENVQTSTQNGSEKVETNTQNVSEKVETSTQNVSEKVETNTQNVSEKVLTSTQNVSEKVLTSTQNVSEKVLTSTQIGPEKVREVISKAISFVGLDPCEGSLVWSLWIEFERAVFHLARREEEKRSQVEKMYDVYRRMVRVPHLSLEDTWKEFTGFVEEMKERLPSIDVERVRVEYESTLKKVKELIPFEECLISPDPSTRLDEWLKYIEFVESKCDPATTQSVYERSLTIHSLHPDLWTKYIDFLDSNFKSLHVSRKGLHRATRNCPWSSALWIKYLRCLERYSVPRNQVVETFESGLRSGLQTGSDFLHLWTAFLDYTRRITDFSNRDDVERIRKSFIMAADHLATIPDSDPTFSILQYSAKVEAAQCNSIQIAREIWNNLMQEPTLSSQALLWIEFFNLERLHGDLDHAKQVLSRGLKLSWDWPETIGQLLIKLEREEGTTLNDFEDALNKYEKTIKRINKKRGTEKSDLDVAQRQKKQKKENQKKDDQKQKHDEKKEVSSSSRKRKAEPSKNTSFDDRSFDDRSFDDDMFKIPAIPNVKRSKNEELNSKKELSSTPELDSKKELSSTPHYVKPKECREKGNELQTVFVSNLDFSVDDEKLREVFSRFGSVVDVRLVRNYKGLSKGFGYIEFAEMGSRREALKNDRMKIGERPCFISELNKKVGFRFNLDLEKKKLFLSNLDPTVTSDQLREIFLPFGHLKDVRIVTYRNGHSKGCAYVEFMDEIAATNGLKVDGLLIGNKNVKVEISHPKRAGMKRTSEPVRTLGSSAVFGESGRKRIDAPMIPSVLRRQLIKNGVSTTQKTNPEPVAGSSLSNNQFRQFLN